MWKEKAARPEKYNNRPAVKISLGKKLLISRFYRVSADRQLPGKMPCGWQRRMGLRLTGKDPVPIIFVNLKINLFS